jgi:phospholipase C
MISARRMVRTFGPSAVVLVVTASSCRANWGLERIETMATPSDPPVTCPVPIPADSLAVARAGCAFGAGAHVSATLGIPPAVLAAIPIRHVIVMMKENRSFDHLFGKLHDEGQPDVESVPASYVNPDNAGSEVAPFHATTTCISVDPEHQATSIKAAVNGGGMNGFVKNAAATTGTDGHFVMAEYDRTDLPFYDWLATTYAVGDRHFAPMQSGTFAARNFLLFGTNAGVVDTGISFPDPNTNSILRSLMNAGRTWGAYTDSEPFSGALGWSKDDPGVHSMRDFFDALDRGTLPNVAFVDGVENVEDDHPTADLQVGEAWSKKIYDHLVRSPQWPRTALLFTYDECGAFADHVPPPNGCLPGDPMGWPFPELGPRVPLVAISPWAKRNYASHVPHDHAAITRFIEAIFDLPALTARDANSDALFDLFDFSCGRDLTPPVGAPDPGIGGCKK